MGALQVSDDYLLLNISLVIIKWLQVVILIWLGV